MTPIDPSAGFDEVRRSIAQRFAQAGIEDAAAEARRLVLTVFGLTATELLALGRRPLGEERARRLDVALARRLAGMPIGRIVSEGEFAGLKLALSPETLEPRDDTETLLRVVLGAIDAAGRRAAPLRILDLGLGTGAILIALLAALPNARGFGVDRAFGAVVTTRVNAARHGLEERAFLWCGDWAEAIDGRFDIIVSNPPYIASAAIDELDPEVREHDPRLALDGGPDGLDAYRRLFPEIRRLLAPEGIAAFEIGFDQAETAARLATLAGAPEPSLHRDLGGRPRVLSFAR